MIGVQIAPRHPRGESLAAPEHARVTATLQRSIRRPVGPADVLARGLSDGQLRSVLVHEGAECAHIETVFAEHKPVARVQVHALGQQLGGVDRREVEEGDHAGTAGGRVGGGRCGSRDPLGGHQRFVRQEGGRGQIDDAILLLDAVKIRADPEAREPARLEHDAIIEALRSFGCQARVAASDRVGDGVGLVATRVRDGQRKFAG